MVLNIASFLRVVSTIIVCLQTTCFKKSFKYRLLSLNLKNIYETFLYVVVQKLEKAVFDPPRFAFTCTFSVYFSRAMITFQYVNCAKLNLIAWSQKIYCKQNITISIISQFQSLLVSSSSLYMETEWYELILQSCRPINTLQSLSWNNYGCHTHSGMSNCWRINVNSFIMCDYIQLRRFYAQS